MHTLREPLLTVYLGKCKNVFVVFDEIGFNFIISNVFYCCFLLFRSGLFIGLGGAGRNLQEVARAICGFTNHRNKGLTSVNRRTSLLSHLQYPVPYLSRLQRI